MSNEKVGFKEFRSVGNQVAIWLPQDWVSEPNENGVAIYSEDAPGTLFLDVLTYEIEGDEKIESPSGAEKLPNGAWFSEGAEVEDEDGVQVHSTFWQIQFHSHPYIIVPVATWAIEDEFLVEPEHLETRAMVRDAIREMTINP